jgi:hypothetical protein
MALRLEVNSGVISCIICACGGKCQSSTESQKSCKLIIEAFNPNKTTPITKLLLHSVFGRKYRLDDILHQYEEKIEINQASTIERIKIFEQIILDDCKSDLDWKICSICEDEYMNEKRAFENVLFIVPELNYCVEHNK